MKKKLSALLCVLLIGLFLTGCGKESTKDSNGINLSVNEIVEKVYEGISEEEMPAVGNIPIDNENMSYYIGVEDLDIKEGVASEPMIGSIAWSVVVLELNDGVDAEKVKSDIKEKVNPAKWICVDAEIVKVESRGNKVILILMDEENENIATTIENNFKNLK